MYFWDSFIREAEISIISISVSLSVSIARVGYYVKMEKPVHHLRQHFYSVLYIWVKKLAIRNCLFRMKMAAVKNLILGVILFAFPREMSALISNKLFSLLCHTCLRPLLITCNCHRSFGNKMTAFQKPAEYGF